MEPLREVISIGDSYPSVQIVGQQWDLINIVYDRATVYANHNESRELMGSRPAWIEGLSRGDVSLTQNHCVIRYGWQNDIIMLFAFEYNNTGELTTIYRHLWQSRDGKDFGVEANPGQDIFITFGRERDLHARFSFNPTSKKWMRNENYRTANFPQVDMEVETERVYATTANAIEPLPPGFPWPGN